MEQLFTISYRVHDLLFYLKYGTGNGRMKNEEDIVNEIESFSYYEYLFFVNEVLKELKVDKDLLHLLFVMKYWDNSSLFQVFERINPSLEDLMTKLVDLSPIGRLFALHYCENGYMQRVRGLREEIGRQLLVLKQINDIRVQCIENECDYYNEEFDWDQAKKLYEVKRSLYDKIIDNIEEDGYYGLFWLEINSRIKDECKIIQNLYPKDSVEYQMIYLMIHDFEDWKNYVANDIVCKKHDFYKRKEFYIEYIKELRRRLGLDYIPKVIYNVEEKQIISDSGEKITIHEIPKRLWINNIIEWLEKTF